MRMICAAAFVGLAACSAMNVSTEMALLESGVTDTTGVSDEATEDRSEMYSRSAVI